MRFTSRNLVILLGATLAQAQSNTTLTAVASGGGERVITESNCSMTNKLALNQQASWSNGVVNTCCGAATGSTCFIRLESTVSGQETCEIPSCADLESGDASKMMGFRTLITSNAQGDSLSFIPSFGQGNGASKTGIAWGTMGVVLAATAFVS